MVNVLFSPLAPRYVVGHDPADVVGTRAENGTSIRAARRDAPSRRRIADLADGGSLALLGEPGCGKSAGLAELSGDGPNVLVVPLVEATSVRAMHELMDLADGGELPGHVATLVLDGVDECPLAAKMLLRQVKRVISANPGVRVLVGCRTADWSTHLEDELRTATADFEVYELEPLSTEDVVMLASGRGIDGEAFVRAVVEAGVGPFARLPLTLDLLLKLYAQRSELPAAAEDIYEQGLLLLAAEPDPGRAQNDDRGGDLEVVAVASRIAAALSLGAAGAVSGGPGRRDGDLARGDLAGGHEPLPAGDIAVGERQIREALATAIFSGRGRNRFGVVHASFAAYLSARFMTAHGMPEHQLRALLTTTSTLGRTRVPTHLRETAAWLVALDPDRHRWVVDLDPGSVLAHSTIVSDPGVRSSLVSHLLEKGDPFRLVPRLQWRLMHPGLDEQLRPALLAPLSEDAGRDLGNPVSRRASTAVTIARASEARGVVPELDALARAANVNSYVRDEAAEALRVLEPAVAARSLRGVLDELNASPDHDPYDELRGVALRACWPATLTAADLPSMLTAPQQSNYIGSYRMFLAAFVDQLIDDDLVRVLQAARGAAPDHLSAGDDEPSPDPDGRGGGVLVSGGGRPDEKLVKDLLSRAMASSVLSGVVDEVGWLLAQALVRHQYPTLPSRFVPQRDEEESPQARRLRRNLIVAAFVHLSPRRSALLGIRWTLLERPRLRAGLVRPVDLDWLFGLANGPYDAHAAALIPIVFEGHPDQLEVVWRHRDTPLFARTIGGRFAAVRLEGPVAARMRADHQLMADARTWEGSEEHGLALADATARCRAGQVEAFADLCRLVRVDGRNGAADDLGDDFREWPSAELLDASNDELMAWGEAFVSATVNEPPLVGPGFVTHRALQGYAALAMLARQADGDERLAALPAEVWERWAPVVVQCPAYGPPDSESVRRQLLQKAAAVVPVAFTVAYLSVVEMHIGGDRFVPDLEPLAGVFTATVGDRLLALARPLVSALADQSVEAARTTDVPGEPAGDDDRRRAAQALTELADFLVAMNHPAAISFLRATLAPTAGTSMAGTDARAVAATSLLTARRTPWAAVTDEVATDERFGRALIDRLARRADGRSLPLGDVSDADLASLWQLVGGWSIDAGSGDPDWKFAHPVEDFRERLLVELSERGTSTALETLALLVTDHPDDHRLLRRLHEAETRQHDNSWTGVSVSELTALVTDARRTTVRDEDDLFRLVVEVLGRAAGRLRTNGQLLWNETRALQDPSSLVWRPKFEADVSAFLADHIAQEVSQHLVINREVLVRQTTSKGQGLAVDVLATGDADGQLGSSAPTCPIEVKGNWNSGLLTDLERQLVEDYLPALGATRGVYVCAWFPVDMWTDTADRRRSAVRSLDRAEVERRLQAVADQVAAERDIRVAVVMLDVLRPAPSVRATRDAGGLGAEL